MLTAIDTNIVIRLIVEDDPQQLKIVEALLKSHQLAIPHTVLLETEWVLRSLQMVRRADQSSADTFARP